MKKVIALLLLILGMAIDAHGQAWSGILSNSRAIDWTNAGTNVLSGSWTRCGSVIAPYGSTTTPGDPITIQNAINNCGTNQYVELGAGTFVLGVTAATPNHGGLQLKSNMVIRGQGADKTFIIFLANNSCLGLYASICISTTDGNATFFGSFNVNVGTGTEQAAWTAGYTSGTTSITLSNVGSGTITNGQYIYLDQNNNTSIPAGPTLPIGDNPAVPFSLEGGAPGRCTTGNWGNINGTCPGGGTNVHRNQVQYVKVVSGCTSPCGGAGPFTITITPGLYGVEWTGGKTPGAWWSSQTVHSGVENLSVDESLQDNGAACNSCAGIAFLNTFESWVTGVRSLYGPRNHVVFWQSAHNVVQNSYFFGAQQTSSQSYGVESYSSSDNLVVNNIMQQCTSPFMLGPAMGNVYIYNYGLNDVYYVPTWQIPSISEHDAGVLYNLFEGNNMIQWQGDVFHGSGGVNTLFRNRFAGMEGGKSQTGNTVAVGAFSLTRGLNIVGNVLGTTGFNTVYQATNGTGAHNQVYELGSGNTEGTVTVPNDSQVINMLMRWGNWDSANGAVKFDNTEIPSAIGGSYQNSVPASHTLPNSFYYASKPSFFNTTDVWPPIGSDLTPMTSVLPANRCYNTISGGSDPNGLGGPYTFSASTCYTTAASPPAVPTGLTATPSSSTMNLAWSVPTGSPTSYKVFRGTASGGPYTQIATATTNSYADNALAGGTYYYVVQACNAAGCSANSTQASGTISGGVSIPSVPTGLTATASGTQINLSWTASTGAPTSYSLQRAPASTGPWTGLATISAPTTSFTDPNLANGTYFYRVAATNTAGTSAYSTTASATVSVLPAASISPSLVSFGNVVVGQTNLLTQTVQIQNSGTANLTTIVVNAPSGPAGADYSNSQDGCTGATLTPLQSCQFVVSFTPSTTGTRSASIVITSNDPTSPDTVTLTGVGTATVTVSPTSINFGNQYVNKPSAPTTVTFNNTSGVTVTFTSVSLATGTQFALSSNTCTGTLANGNACTVNVTFTPTSAGLKTDTLSFAFTGAAGSPQTVALQGKGQKHGVMRVGAFANWRYDGTEIIKTVLRPWRREEYAEVKI